MNPTAAFLTDIALVVFVSLGLVLYVRTHLKALLIELCGTAERGNFWVAFSNVTLVLVPLMFALDYAPASGPGRNFVFEMATQFKLAIMGFVAALSLLSFILFVSIPRNKAPLPLADRKGQTNA